jgi:hypothetical protein
VGENEMVEEMIETIGGRGGEENMKEVSEISESKGKPAESGATVGEAGEASEMQGREEGSSWAERVEEEEMLVEEEAAEGRPKLAMKRRGKAKNKSSDSKASRLGKDRQTGKKQTAQTDSDSGEECLSDDSDTLNMEKLSCSQRTKMYLSDKIKSFLQDTKNVKGVKLEEYFPDILAFYVSARFYANRLESGITDQEMYRKQENWF